MYRKQIEMEMSYEESYRGSEMGLGEEMAMTLMSNLFDHVIRQLS